MAAAVFPFGIVLNLVFFGLVAVATTGIFYGIGFSLIEHREEIAKLDTDRSKADSLLREISPQWHSDAPPDDREAGSGKGEPEISAPAPEIIVAEWGTGYSLKDAQKQVLQTNMVHGRPLFLWMTLHGTQAAVDRMRAGHRLAMEIHWVRKSGSDPFDVADQVMDLTIGRPGFADGFEEQVRRRGFFEWHSWARRDSLGVGMWTVSLASSDGQLLLCGPDSQLCQFTVNVE